MECNVIKDLIPLYIDGCCSEESAEVIEEHIKNCGSCKDVLYNMKRCVEEPEEKIPLPIKPGRISLWKASVLQSVLLFMSFLIITLGVASEAASPVGPDNGFWAFTLVFPATGFMLSLTNWYFVRLYRNRRSFSLFSLVFTALTTLLSFAWGAFHYEAIPLKLAGAGLIFSVLLCALSGLLSNLYAKMIGKE